MKIIFVLKPVFDGSQTNGQISIFMNIYVFNAIYYVSERLFIYNL